jgi:hypothetical protein
MKKFPGHTNPPNPPEKPDREFSEAQAVIIKRIMNDILLLHSDFLKKAAQNWRENLNRRDAMSVLNPRPFIHNESQELDSVKLKQLDLLIKLCENSHEIIRKESGLLKAQVNEGMLKDLFGDIF